MPLFSAAFSCIGIDGSPEKKAIKALILIFHGVLNAVCFNYMFTLRILKGPLGKYYQAGPIALDEDAWFIFINKSEFHYFSNLLVD